MAGIAALAGLIAVPLLAASGVAPALNVCQVRAEWHSVAVDDLQEFGGDEFFFQAQAGTGGLLRFPGNGELDVDAPRAWDIGALLWEGRSGTALAPDPVLLELRSTEVDFFGDDEAVNQNAFAPPAGCGDGWQLVSYPVDCCDFQTTHYLLFEWWSH